MLPGVIYALVDPRTDVIRYVGKTVRTAHRRLRRHLARCYLDDANTHKNRWLRQLLSYGLEPRIVVLETCEAGVDLSAAEIRWIAELRGAGVRLTNATAGGEGMAGWKHTAETLKKIRTALTGKPKSPEHRAKLIATLKGRKASEETREKLRTIHSARPRLPWSESARISISRGKGGLPFEDQHGTRYETIKGAARQLGLRPEHICKVLKGKRRSTGGYVFRYLSVQEWPA